MDSQPSKPEIEAVFHRLRAIPANKMCFDCNASNPTWASVTYGVFICIDCSAVHRSLGVHLTFVRSTQLDTNWTWVQLRQMQLGGNSNATQFFSQHNCNTNDAQKKYNSRAAQLYRDKLNQAALSAIKTNKELHIHPHEEKNEEKHEEDFFSEHEKFESPDIADAHITVPQDYKTNAKNDNENLDGPNVNFSLTSESQPRKSTLGSRKPPAKKMGLGAKKGGLGATKVKTNFADLEREAELAEATRLRMIEENSKQAALSAKEAEEKEAAVRLAYKDLSEQQHKREEQMKKQDPKKAEQVERLGMGISAKSGVSHSALTDMQVIEQENVQTTQSTLSSLGKLRISDTDYFDDYISGTGIYSPGFGSSRSKDFSKDFFGESNSSSKDSWVVVEDFTEKPKPRQTPIEYEKPREKKPTRIEVGPSTDEAQKKFGNAKAISSDQFFNDGAADYETKANLNRFQGSSSISSAEFFGNGSPAPSASSNLSQYDLEDVKESVRQGVTKVAGKLGSLANGLYSSIQDRYGY